MENAPRLKIQLFRGWMPVECPNGPTTYSRNDNDSAWLQFSSMTYKGSKNLDLSDEKLLGIAKRISNKDSSTTVVSSDAGLCNFCRYGTVIIRGNKPGYFQAWVLSNSRDVILVTYNSTAEPDPQELEEATAIALATQL